MLLQSARGMFVVALSLFIAYVLAVVSLPDWIPDTFSYARPRWLVLVVFYWIISLPHRHDVLLAWVAGLLMDVLLGGLLGQHALAMLAVATIATHQYQQVRMYTIMQQVFLMLGLMVLLELILYLIDFLTTGKPWQWWYLLTAVVSAGAWPWVFGTLRHARRQYAVS